MTLRSAVAGEEAALAVFLRRHVRGSMFPLTLLAEQGIGAPLDVWVDDRNGIEGVLVLTGGGILLPQAPGQDWQEARHLLAGRQIAMLLGPDGQVPLLLRALNLGHVPPRHIAQEPGFVLDLSDLQMPDCSGLSLTPLPADRRALLLRWRADYLAETFEMPADEAGAKAAEDLDRWMARDSHRLLMREGEPVALTGFNAQLPDVVQVGGVYTPPERRRQGLARRAVALHLAEARRSGVQRAVLFAANEAAATAYRAIGFQRDGTMDIVEFAAPQVVP